MIFHKFVNPVERVFFEEYGTQESWVCGRYV